MECVKFAKEVRRANKLLAKVEESAKNLATGQTTAEQKIETQVSIIQSSLMSVRPCLKI